MTTDLDNLIDTLKPQLDNLVASFDVKPDERWAFADASRGLFRAYDRTLNDRGAPHIPPMLALLTLEVLCAEAGEIDYAAAIRTIVQYIEWARGEAAKLN